jgi:hypothetical protein
MPIQPEQKLSEKDIYKDEETLLLYFRDDKDNVYCLDLDTKAIYFCCHL